MRSSIKPRRPALPLLNWNRSAAVLMVVVAVMLASCRSREQDVSADSRPQVLTTFTVLADLARNVAGERLQVA
ncbi:MAG: metal ABC transporter substrate-binding protein, partial [Cyanobacteria bacterium MAG COS1_bin_9]|nr:metal ABC transporter substrate-binding protein [Cyanobacteria bacterium MAG COS1_bin_9]